MKLEQVVNAINTNQLLRPGSRKTYTDHIKQLSRDLEENNIRALLMKTAKVSTYLEKTKQYAVNSLKAIYTSINTVIKNVDLKLPSKVIDFYFNKMQSYADLSKKQSESNPKHPKFKGQKLPRWDDLVALNDLFKDRKFGNKDHMIIALYTLRRPRRGEYRLLKYYEGKAPEAAKDKENYVLKADDGTYKLIVNDYKTMRTFGRYESPITEALAKVIERYVKGKKIKSGQSMFKTAYGNLYEESAFSRMIMNTFKKYFTLPIGINDLRHIYITDLSKSKRFLTTAEKRQIAYDMGHSLMMQEQYRVDDSQDSAKIAEEGDEGEEESGETPEETPQQQPRSSQDAASGLSIKAELLALLKQMTALIAKLA